MSWGLLRLAALLVVLASLLGFDVPAFAQSCTKGDIAAVIDSTAAQLRKLNAGQQPALQAKLRQLGEQRGWKESELDAKAAEFLQDAETRALDEQASQLLIELDVLGDEGEIDQKTCLARLAELKKVSAQLIEITQAKAAHVNARINAALNSQGAQKKVAQPPAPKSEPKTVARAEPPRKPSASAPARTEQEPQGRRDGSAPSASGAWETDTVQHAAPGEPTRAPAPDVLAALPPRIPQPEELEFTNEEIWAAGRGFFGSMSAGLASVIEYAFQKYGRPNGYILGSEGGAALLAGVRYGDGRLVTKTRGERKVYWQGPSVGYDLGLAGSRVMFLVYNLQEPDELFARFIGVDGSAYLVGGVGVTFLKKGNLVLAPIRTGLGLRVGANVGYLKFTPDASINPF